MPKNDLVTLCHELYIAIIRRQFGLAHVRVTVECWSEFLSLLSLSPHLISQTNTYHLPTCGIRNAVYKIFFNTGV